jgi:ABC-type uncharacterized transport system auxiliary subunit
MPAAIAVLAMLGACSFTRPAPIKGTYVLEPPFPPAVARSQPGMLRVGTTVIAAPYRSRAFVFRETDLKYETDYYHEFLVAPSANIGEVTARALAGAKVFTAVAPSGVLADADWVLESFVNALYGDIRDKDKPAVVLSITYFLRRGDSDAAVPVWSKTYDRRVAFATGSAAAYVTALNTAFEEILAELARDLAAASVPPK